MKLLFTVANAAVNSYVMKKTDSTVHIAGEE